MTNIEIKENFKHLIKFLKGINDEDRKLRSLVKLLEEKIISKQVYNVLIKEVVNGEDRKS
jgi:hypothetical protein